jgi:5-methylcytosine-specific restriction enzyme B
MTKKSLAAILWRKVQNATVSTLIDQSPGQYDIRLGNSDQIAEFFANVPHRDETSLGGFTLDVPIDAYDGPDPVGLQNLRVRFMGTESQRQDWNIPSQRVGTAYPLWRVGRGLPTGTTTAPAPAHYIILARDIEDKFHARWLTAQDVELLPEILKNKVKANALGVFNVTTTNSELALAISATLKEHFNVLIYGPPGTGKTHVMQEVVQTFRTGYFIDTEKERGAIGSVGVGNVKVGWVTFHQSYSYEEFIVGLRPDPSSSKQLSLIAVPGLLLELAEFARQPGNSALLVIDEINRGNVSRIFGEFITLIEREKRLADDGSETPFTVPIRLPYIKPEFPVEVDIGSTKVQVPNPFTMPRRLYTLASMNSVDKSIAPLDTALRRRFQVVNLEPNLAEISRHMGIDFDPENLALAELNSVDEVKAVAVALLAHLNRDIGFYLGPEYALGQWYLSGLIDDFQSVDDAKAVLANIWKSQLLPQLEELFHGRIEQLQTVLNLPEGSDETTPVYLESPPEEVTELGGTPFLRRRDVSTDQLMTFLLRISGVPTPTSSETRPANEPSAQYPGE